MTAITAAVVRVPGGDWTLETLRLDEPRDDEVLVRIVGVGVCHTDVSIRNQALPLPLPAVLGHEGAGVVERVGSGVTGLAPGDHVVLSPRSCGHCGNCQDAAPMYCDDFIALNIGMCRPDGSPTIFDGQTPIAAAFFGQSSFATMALASARSAIKVPKDLPLELLGPLGCGIQTGAGAVINALSPRCGDSLAVFGAGPVGLSAIMAARVVGCATIVAVDIQENRLEMARELGATHVVNSAAEDARRALRQLTAGRGVRHAIDTTALPDVIRQAVDCLAMPGTCAIVGLSRFGEEVSLDLHTLLSGRSVRGVTEGDCVPALFIPQLIDLWRQGRFPFDRLIRTYPLAEINEAVADCERGTTFKPVLLMPPA